MNKYIIDNHEYTVEACVGLITRECAERIMTSNDFKKWCELTSELLTKQYKEQEEYARTHYFPGCYGDPLTDCN